jgi:hypothetical protein
MTTIRSTNQTIELTPAEIAQLIRILAETLGHTDRPNVELVIADSTAKTKTGVGSRSLRLYAHGVLVAGRFTELSN